MSEGKIHAAICSVMADIGAVGKNDSNDFDKYKYRGIDAVMNALHPAMVKNHVYVIPSVLESTREDRTSRKGEPLIYSVLKVKYTFYTDDGSSVDAVVVGEALDRSDKSTNKAMSAAYKYACFQTFCIPTEEFIDSEKETLEPAPKNATQVGSNGYPDRNTMLNKIAAKYPPGTKQEAALLAAFNITALEQASDAQLQAVYGSKIAKK